LVSLNVFSLATFFGAAAISFVLLFCLRPLLAHYALAKPTARSSHKKPTPQGGGIAVIIATMIIIAIAAIFFPEQFDKPFRLTAIFAAAIGLALVGATDDVRPLEAIPRLILQTAAVAVVLAALPPEMRVIPAFPWWLERAVLLVAGVWFVNVVNFMDGIDWLTVAEVVPITLGLAMFGLMGILPQDATLVAVALCGAMIGFAPFNRPIAQLFLGDVGSLPIGLLLGWLLVLLAGRGHLAAAALMPLYYLADATVTLLRRLINGEPITQAHRSHFYQRALDNGFSVYQIVGRVFVVNIILVGSAAVTILKDSPILQLMMPVVGCAVVGALLWTFNHAYRRRQ
jgi:UDP-N-acetylmuramyl pentapeptide phosphotransferase/UDP-N-acetylglucosamine-1-phosphate transferase